MNLLNRIFNKKKYYLDRAQISLYKNDHINAAKYFELYFKKESNDIGILKNIGLEFAKNNKHELAIFYFSLYLTYRPTDVYILSDRGAQYYFTGNKDKALDDLNNSRLFMRNQKIKRKDEYFFSLRSLRFTFLEEYRKALEDINSAIKLNPEPSTYYNNRAKIYEKLNMGTEAEADAKMALSIDERNQTIEENKFVNQVLEKFKDGFYGDAVKSLKSGIIKYPDNPTLLYKHAELYSYHGMSDGEFDSSYLHTWYSGLSQAVSDLEKLNKIDPNYPNAKSLLKKTRVKLSEVKNALKTIGF